MLAGVALGVRKTVMSLSITIHSLYRFEWRIWWHFWSEKIMYWLDIANNDRTLFHVETVSNKTSLSNISRLHSVPQKKQWRIYIVKSWTYPFFLPNWFHFYAVFTKFWPNNRLASSIRWAILDQPLQKEAPAPIVNERTMVIVTALSFATKYLTSVRQQVLPGKPSSTSDQPLAE